MANIQVISQIKKKINDSDQALYHIGPELKYVGALLSSNNNNLEEQLLIGIDKIIKEQTEVDIDRHDIKKTKIEFRKPNDTENYYILEISEYSPEAGMGNIYVRGRNIYLQEIMSADESDNSAREDEYNETIYYENNGLHIAPDIIIENFNLIVQFFKFISKFQIIQKVIIILIKFNLFIEESRFNFGIVSFCNSNTGC